MPEDHPVIEMLNEMQSAADKIGQINQQLLALGRCGHYTMEPIDLNILIKKEVISQQLSKEIILHKDLSSNLFLIKGGPANLPEP